MQSKHRKKGENKKRKTSLQEGKRKSLLTLTGLLMEGLETLCAGRGSKWVRKNSPSRRFALPNDPQLTAVGFQS
jgi:hypothetical protein